LYDLFFGVEKLSMIRPLGETDREALLGLIMAAPQYNMYMLGNLHAYGFGADFCEYFGDVVDGEIRGVLSRYETGWLVYGRAGADWAGLGHILDSHPMRAQRLQDNPGGIESFLPYVHNYVGTFVEETFMQLPNGALKVQPVPEGFVIRKATLDNLATLVRLFADAGDMTRTPAGIERPLRERRVWVALKEGEAVSAALTNAETKTTAMIGGVFTAAEWRGHGLSQAVCSRLCEELIEQQLQPVLYWKNPAAGHVYAKLGFQTIGVWRSVWLTQRES
jgi:N-acetylglutamate synthase-like GNAT family acetyltransferase